MKLKEHYGSGWHELERPVSVLLLKAYYEVKAETKIYSIYIMDLNNNLQPKK